MTDLEIVRACASAMGWKHLGAVGVELTAEELKLRTSQIDAKYPKQLWCLSGGNDWWETPEGSTICGRCQSIPDPLHDDAQAMALGKAHPEEFEEVVTEWASMIRCGERPDLNRMLCERIAKGNDR